MTSSIALRDVVKEYPGEVRAVDGVDLSIAPGEFFALLGPSGCGKTTLLRSIAGLETITEGTCHIGDRDVTDLEPGERGVAMVFQDYALFPHMDVSDNIAYPLRIQKVAKATRRETAATTASRLSLGHLLERRPGQLSGGQQQRVALARAMATRPQVLLLDEPLSNLDARLRLEARTFLKELQTELGLTTVFVTHDQSEALALADRMAVMKDGEILQVGTPREVFHDPRTQFVAGFIGSQPMNLLHGTVREGHVECASLRLPLAELIGQDAGTAGKGAVSEGGEPPSEGAEVTVGIRPEYVTVDAARTAGGQAGDVRRAQVDAPVATVENLGASVLVTGRLGEERLQGIMPDDLAPEIGAQGEFSLALDRVALFDRSTGLRIGGGRR